MPNFSKAKRSFFKTSFLDLSLTCSKDSELGGHDLADVRDTSDNIRDDCDEDEGEELAVMMLSSSNRFRAESGRQGLMETCCPTESSVVS